MQYPTIGLCLAVVWLVLGLAVLTWSSDRFVEEAALLARRFGVSTFTIGAVLVGFGTSLPELAVSVLSSAGGRGDLALANVYGSNVCNIAFVLGIATLVGTMRVKRIVRWQFVPILLFTILLSWMFLMVFGGVSRLTGCVLLFFFFALMPSMMMPDGPIRLSWALATLPQDAYRGSIPGAAVFLALLLGASYFVVWGAVAIAGHLGLTDLGVGRTIVAIGTSFPELATTLAAARRRDTSLALGNIIGSNFFNTLFIVGLAAIVHPIGNVADPLIWCDLPMCALVTLLLLRHRLRCKWGLLLVLLYVLYLLVSGMTL